MVVSERDDESLRKRNDEENKLACQFDLVLTHSLFFFFFLHFSPSF